MKEFKKLVRGKIPYIIRNQGKKSCIKKLSDDEFLFELDKKLTEKINKYQESKEFADVLEVIYAICKAQNFSIEELHKIREEKLNERGGFFEKIFLLSKE